MSSIGRRLKLARKYLKLTKSYVAMQLNVTEDYIEALENGTYVPFGEQLEQFAKLYVVTVEELQTDFNENRCIWDFKNLRAHFLSCSTADQIAIVDLIILKSRLKAAPKMHRKTEQTAAEGGTGHENDSN